MNNISGGNKLIDAYFVLGKAQVEEKMKIGDLGCGTSGHFVFPASKMVGKSGAVYAVDILKTVLESVGRRAKQENYNNVKTVWSNLEIFGATKIDSNSLDVVLLVNTLHQSHKRAEILRESKRMLKKGGRLVVVEWKSIALPFGPPLAERVNLDLLKKAAEKMGLKFEDEFFAGNYHYGVVFIKQE